MIQLVWLQNIFGLFTLRNRGFKNILVWLCVLFSHTNLQEFPCVFSKYHSLRHDWASFQISSHSHFEPSRLAKNTNHTGICLSLLGYRDWDIFNLYAIIRVCLWWSSNPNSSSRIFDRLSYLFDFKFYQRLHLHKWNQVASKLKAHHKTMIVFTSLNNLQNLVSWIQEQNSHAI